MISKNKVDILFRIKSLRLKKTHINTEIKELLAMLKDENKHNMTQRQRRNIHKAREALASQKFKKDNNKKA